MGDIRQKVKISATRETTVIALIDTGAQISAIRPDIVAKIGAQPTGQKIDVEDITGRKVIATLVSFRIQIKHSYITTVAAIIPIKDSIVIGNDFLQDNKAYITMERDRIVFNQYAPKIRRVYRI